MAFVVHMVYLCQLPNSERQRASQQRASTSIPAVSFNELLSSKLQQAF
ncbi:hypothetical protein COLO4_37663 [Corchorus olitorius]|uniref:Uncharacterized protein n=1 Tax=Corchorus olitorius TaxID=93759 RepID=A0A1R3G055_9ROSI|nr:hypothetical protein COLO4_37663 [Corchorus olitorius]